MLSHSEDGTNGPDRNRQKYALPPAYPAIASSSCPIAPPTPPSHNTHTWAMMKFVRVSRESCGSSREKELTRTENRASSRPQKR